MYDEASVADWFVENMSSNVIASWPLTSAWPFTLNVAAPYWRSYELSVLSSDAYVMSGVNIWSLTTSKWKVCDDPRAWVKLTVTGIMRGPAPRRPAIAVARSCRNVPMTSPVLDSLNDENRLGRTVYTYARVIGNSVGPRLYSGWPNA